MSWLLRLYPRAWRERYGEEVEDLVRSQPRSFRLFVDLVAGAVDARMNTHLLSAATAPGGNPDMSTILRLCSSPRFTSEEMRASAAWMIGGSLGIAALGVIVQLVWRQNVLSQTLIYASYPLALVLAGQPTYLKPYPRAVRWALTALVFTGMFLFFLAVTWLAFNL